MAYNKNILVRISDSNLWLILPPQSLNMNQQHQIMCGLKISIHDVTYQEPLDHWCKRILRYIRNHANSLQRGSVEKLNAIVSPDIVMLH